MKKNVLTKYLALFLLVCLVLDGILLCFCSDKAWWNNWMITGPNLYMILGAFYCHFMKKNVDEHPNKLTFAVYGAALLVELLQRQRDAFGLTLLSDGIDLQTETRSSAAHKHHIYSILDSLLTTDHKSDESARTTSFVEALHLTAERLHRRSMVVLFTDAFIKQDDWDALLDALRHLRHNKHEVLLFHTYEQAREMDFAFDNRPTEFIDLETHRKLRLNPSELAETYAAEMHRRRDTLKQKTIQYGIDYVPVAVEKGFEQVMVPYLLKRGKHF